jgi:hypothetical protein
MGDEVSTRLRCFHCYRESMRQEPEFFDGRELRLLFMARRLREALKLEDLLTQSGVDYCVETGSYEGGLVFRTELTGAFFYVDPHDLERSQRLLVEHRFRPYETERGR